MVHRLYEWSIGEAPADIHLLYLSADRHLWAVDRATSRVINYRPRRPLSPFAGSLGRFPGRHVGVHGFSVDQEGNVYVAEVDNGRVQKYRRRAGAKPAMLVGTPVYAAWK